MISNALKNEYDRQRLENRLDYTTIIQPQIIPQSINPVASKPVSKPAKVQTKENPPSLDSDLLLPSNIKAVPMDLDRDLPVNKLDSNWKTEEEYEILR